jgi:hypothetical protein
MSAKGSRPPASPPPPPPPVPTPKPTPPPQPAPAVKPSKTLPAVPINMSGLPGGGMVGMSVAVDSGGGAGAVTARQAGGLIDMKLPVSPRTGTIPIALQNLAKAINIAFQTNYGENHLESVYHAAIVRKGEIQIVHKEYFGYGYTWFSQFGKLLQSMSLTLQGPDPASPEGQRAIQEIGPRSIRGLLNLMGRKMDLVPEYEDKVPAYVEQMLDRLEASGIIVGWTRDEWDIWTTAVGLDVKIRPKEQVAEGSTE